MTNPNPLASLPLAELQPLAALLGKQPEEIVGQIARPLVDVMNQQLFPALMVAWACLGIVLYDGAIHLFKYDIFLFRRWRSINILYLVLRYVGTASAVFYTIWSVLGQTSLCDAEAKTALFLQAFATLAASGIFYVRIATLTNKNKFALVFFAIVALADFGLLLHAAADGVFGVPPPAYVPLITCIPGEYTRLIVALPCYVTVFYDLCVLAVTFNALRKFRQEKFKGGPVLKDGQTTGSDLKWILLRDNMLYVGVVSAVELAQGIIVWFNISPLTEIILTPVVIAVTVVMGCRVFVELKFVLQSEECTCRRRLDDTTLIPSRSTKANGEMQLNKADTGNWAPAVYDPRMDARSLESGFSHDSSTVGDSSVIGRAFTPSSQFHQDSMSITGDLTPFEPTEVVVADMDEAGIHLSPRILQHARTNATSRIVQSQSHRPYTGGDDLSLPIWQTYSRHANDALPPPPRR